MLRSIMKGGLGVLTAALLAVPTSLSAQQVGQITGTVTDADSGQPLSAVQISVPGTGLGAVTGAEGSYTIQNVPAGTHTVTAQRLGFQQLRQEDVTVAAGESTTVNLQLSPTVLALQEIVATGLVDPVEGVRSPISVGRVSRDQMPVMAAGSAVESLQGRVPGVAINRGSGNPGSGTSIMLRTPTSARTGTGAPLFVVDGVILGGGTTNLESLDIESIEVVRGAAAASLYGSRAASGVISITTARGSNLEVGQTQFSARAEVGLSSPVRLSDEVPRVHAFSMNEAGTEYLDSGGDVIDRSQPGWREQRHVPSVAFLDQPYLGETYDNLGIVLRPAGFNTQNFSVFQNAGTTNFAVTANRYFEGGTLENQTGYERNSFRVNLDHQLRDDLRMGISAFHSRDHRDNVQASFTDMINAAPDINYGARDPVTGEFERIPDPTTGIQNPLWNQANLESDRRRIRTLANANLAWDPMYWLTLSGNISYDRHDTNSRSFTERGTPFVQAAGDDSFSGGSISLTNSISDTWNAEADVTVRQDFGALNVRSTVRGLWEDDHSFSRNASGTDFFIAGVPRINNAQERDGSSSQSDVRAIGLFWDTAFDYDGKYIATFLVRRDGSSLFGPDNRWHNYYRVGGAWRMGEEDWFNVPNVQEFKLRYARGTAGGRPGFSAQYETWSVGSGGVSQQNLGNRNLRPEHTTEQEVALEMILYDRFGVELVHAWQRTEDQLFNRSVPAFTGFSNQWENGGTVTGHTTEARIEAQLVQRPDFGWNTMFIADRSRGKIDEWVFACENPTYRMICDDVSIYSIWGWQFLYTHDELAEHLGGIDESNWDQFQVNDDGYLVWVGDFDYTDGIAEDLWGTTGQVDGHNFQWGVPFLERDDTGTVIRQQIGDGAHVNLGLSNNVRWRQFSFHAHLQAAVGGEAVNRSFQEMVLSRTYPGMDESGKPEELKKPLHYYEALYASGGGSGSHHFLESADYLKLRTASVSYRMSQGHMDRLGVSRMGISSLTLGLVGRNLFTVTNYSGWDPEQALNLNSRLNQDRFNYPSTRNFTAEVSVTF